MELGKDKWYGVKVDFKSIALSVGRLLSRPHVLASHGDHFQKKPDMGDDLFRRRYRQDLAAWEMHKARAYLVQPEAAGDNFTRVETPNGEFHVRPEDLQAEIDGISEVVEGE